MWWNLIRANLWNLWVERNHRTFKDVGKLITHLLENTLHTAAQLCTRSHFYSNYDASSVALNLDGLSITFFFCSLIHFELLSSSSLYLTLLINESWLMLQMCQSNWDVLVHLLILTRLTLLKKEQPNNIRNITYLFFKLN